MKTTKSFKRFISTMVMGIFIITNLNPLSAFAVTSNTKIIYPIKEISKLECRFEKFSTLWSDCKQSLPILKTKDYERYSKLNWWYNDYTRIYTVLWWASYKYGWDVWNGWHIWTDIATAEGTPVYAMANWKVIKAKNDIALWNYVSIEHEILGKKVVSTYAHLSKINMSLWQKVNAWDKVWEVWSTWNSTWNHLHFQLDLENPFYPYYYDYKVCPYSYNTISETWICFNELKKHTIDPLLFLETSWEILNSIQVVTKKIPRQTPTNTVSKTTDTKWYDMSIFNRTVHKWYPIDDIKKVQLIFRDLWEYKWQISWDYDDIEESIVSYQIKNKVISNRSELWAWWFGPKTRAQAKHDYENFIAHSWKPSTLKDSEIDNIEVTIDNKVSTQKISRTWMLSREEIEAREVDDFLKKYNVELRFKDIWWNIWIWKTSTLYLEVTDKRWRPFKWNMPSGMTFIADFSKVSVFPEKLYNFTDGSRDIKLTWVKEWNTTLYIKVWNKTIKSIDIKIYNTWETIYPDTWKIYSNSTVVLSDTKTAIALFEDNAWQRLINLRYGSTFTLDWWDNALVCIKRWSLKDIRNIYRKWCNTNDYVSKVSFDYSDTLDWLLVFDYKVIWKSASIKISNNYDNQILTSKSIKVTDPKWLSKNYAYRDEVLDMLERWIATWLNKWYFLEDRWLVESDWLEWIENTLETYKRNTVDSNTISIINSSLNELKKEKVSKFNSLTREKYLDLVYKYLVFEKSHTSSTTDYRDLDQSSIVKVSTIFDENETWRDRFWENYYRPEVPITRWEWAFLLAKAIEKNERTFLTLR